MLLWKGESHPVGTLGGKEFVVSDAARALGYTVASDPSTGVLTLTGQGHQILLGPGTAQVPVDRRIIPISLPARVVGGALYAPVDFFEKVLFPLAGATGSYDAAKRVWTLTAAGPPPLSIEVAVVHVAPTTQVVLRLSGGREDRHGALGARLRGPLRRHPARPAVAREEVRRSARGRGPLLRRHDDGGIPRAESRGARLPAHLAGPPRHRGRPQGRGGRGSRRAGRARPGRDPAADGGRRPRARRRRDRGHRAGRAPGEGSDAPDREEARRHAAEGSFVPDRAHAGLGRPDPARRPRLDREPREGGPVPLRPRQLLARRLRPRDPRRTTSRSRRRTRSPRRSPRKRTRRARRPGPARRTRPAITTSTSSCGTSPRART